jgi:NAD-dependent dihydropyrimidine dehydrogenase PreA subunit
MSGDLDGTFIEVDLTDEVRGDAAMAAKLEEVCPVDIYSDAGGTVEVVRKNLDECVLCGLCLDVTPPGGVVIRKLYDGTELKR